LEFHILVPYNLATLQHVTSLPLQCLHCVAGRCAITFHQNDLPPRSLHHSVHVFPLRLNKSRVVYGWCALLRTRILTMLVATVRVRVEGGDFSVPRTVMIPINSELRAASPLVLAEDEHPESNIARQYTPRNTFDQFAGSCKQ